MGRCNGASLKCGKWYYDGKMKSPMSYIFLYRQIWEKMNYDWYSDQSLCPLANMFYEMINENIQRQ